MYCPLYSAHANFGRALAHLLTKSQTSMNVWLDCEASEWSQWNKIRSMCETSSALHVALRIESFDLATTTDSTDDTDLWNRWMGEPVRALFLEMSMFIPNATGYPTLPPKARKIVVRFFERGVQFVLCGRPRHVNGYAPYQMYLQHLCTKSATDLSSRDEFESPFYDYLQIPLQPLGDNLESQTYETFEKDPVKYARYEEAVYCALEKRKSQEHQQQEQLPHSTPQEFTIYVVGAGRGPLVKASLRAANRASARVRIFAVEKNPNAVITLMNEWPRNNRDGVEVVRTDMRDWNAPSKADIIVSELLGSWGDNELSPECLIGVETFLKPTVGVSIPSQYTSFVAPITSHKVWSEVRNLSKAALDTDPSTAPSGVGRFETPYVVRLFNFYDVADPQPCFTFDHMPREVSVSNDSLERYACLEFIAKTDAMVHGFAGYFSSVLFEQVNISILPSTFSEGMFSWFPLFIPLREPVFLNRGERLKAYFWRKTSKTKVWYEWCVETSKSMGAMHNPTGRSYAVNL